MARRPDADALAALLEGRTAPDDAPRSLTRLAGLATAVREHTDLDTPTDEFRDALRAELLQVAAAGRPTLWERVTDRAEAATAGFRYSMRAAGAAALASSLIGTAGVAAAAQSALPGDVLYSVKGLTEDARLAFAAGDVERGRLHLAFARERLDEVEAGRERLTADQITATLDSLDREAATGADELLAAALAGTTDPVLEELDAFTAELRGRILDLTRDLPLSVRPATERTLEVLRRIDVQVAGLLGLGDCDVCGGVAGGAARVVLPGDGPASPPCRCVGTTPATDAREDDGDTDGSTTPQEQPQSRPTDSSLDAEGTPDTGTSIETGTDTDELAEVVDEVGGAVDDLGSELDEVLEPVEDVGSLVDDLLDPSNTTTSGPAGETVDRLGGTVDDTTGELGGATGDLLE